MAPESGPSSARTRRTRSWLLCQGFARLQRSPADHGERSSGKDSANVRRSNGKPTRHARIQGNLVGVEGFELSTSCSQSKRATGLRHTPNGAILPKPPVHGQTEFSLSIHAAPMRAVRLAIHPRFVYKAGSQKSRAIRNGRRSAAQKTVPALPCQERRGIHERQAAHAFPRHPGVVEG